MGVKFPEGGVSVMRQKFMIEAPSECLAHVRMPIKALRHPVGVFWATLDC